ncbi:MAG: molybdopterin biosynthesis protein [Eubacteriaceae bacterium]|nr:molybdopterin biosynthesis protein [Eubacteriaceae bacterium]
MTQRNLYLSNTPVDEALEKYMEAFGKIATVRYETIKTEHSLGRVTRHATYAKYSSPMYNASAMDGVAVVSEATSTARETNPLTLKKGKDYVIVDTGDPVRHPFDSVIMAEDIVETGEDMIKIFASAAPWENVRPVGEDIVAGEMILPSNHEIRPIDIGVLLSAGITELEVVKRPQVAIFPTGTEIIEPGVVPKEGDIIESNSRMFEAMVAQGGGEGFRFPPIIDDYELIKNAISEAADNYDMVIVNAGSSAGTEDYTVHVLRELGEVIIHGVAVKPGKPVILSIVKGKPVIGLPGYPVSAYIAFENFVRPVLTLLSRREEGAENEVTATVSRRIVSSLKHREYVRVKVGSVDGRMIASPLARGAGAAMSLVRADGFCIIDLNCEGVEAGEKVKVQLYRPKEEIENTVVIIGSHDMLLDIIGDMMPNLHRNMFVSSTHVGSLGGLMALKRGECHIAPTHLLNEDTGVYNISYIKEIFDEPMVLIKGVHRIQGIMVKPGNPLNIKTVSDIPGKRFVNRQRGAGTRVLFDYKLKCEGISPQDINGYDREAATHMAVAALVAGDSADCGMGVYSAAKAMGLDFIEVGPEEYDFAMRARHLELPGIKAFLEILQSDDFKDALTKLGGYAFANTGEIIKL